MESWRVMLLATAGQLAISLWPQAFLQWRHQENYLSLATWGPVALLALLLVVWLWVETLATRRRIDDRGNCRDSGVAQAWVSCLLLLAAIWLGQVECGFRPQRSLVALVGGSLAFLTGIMLRGVAIWQLGAAFRSRHALNDNSQLQTGGLYGWIRHPSESGLLLIAAGIALILQSWMSATLLIGGLLPATLIRLHAEERMLRRVCGRIHVQYCGRTSLLFPRLFLIRSRSIRNWWNSSGRGFFPW